MTESQLPAAAAQKFGTLIPNRIFGEFWWWSDFVRFSNCIMSFPYIFKSDGALVNFIITVQLVE